MTAAVHGPRRQWVGIDPRKVAECSQAHIAYLVEDAIADICALSNREAALLASQAELVEALEWYADQLCEGWCEGKDPKACAGIGSDNCAGCPAVVALTKARTDATGEVA